MARDGRALDRRPRGSLVRLASALRRYRVLRMTGASENIHRVAHVGPGAPDGPVRANRDIRVIADEPRLVGARDGEVGEPTCVRGDRDAGIEAFARKGRRGEILGCREGVSVDAALTWRRGPCPIHKTDAYLAVRTDRGPGKDLVVGGAALHERRLGPSHAPVR